LGVVATARLMLRPLMLRFLLLRFLPRRLLPVLIVLDVIRMIRGWQKRNTPPINRPPGRRVNAVEVRKPDRGTEGGWIDRTDPTA
jgi:hypothetical protein